MYMQKKNWNPKYSTPKLGIKKSKPYVWDHMNDAQLQGILQNSISMPIVYNWINI
jgi:hypothetical protein